VRETNSARLFFVDDRVYKAKKAVDLGFRTLEARRRACWRELELNRRLAPDVYLDVATVSGSDGEPCDYLLVMRRLSDDLRLSTMVQSGRATEADIGSVARVLARFHASAERAVLFAPQDWAAELRRRWTGLFDSAEAHRGDVITSDELDQVRDLASGYVDGRAALLRERAEGGWVVDGHGDLLADDIFCLPDGPRVLDCLDFDDRLRMVDVLDDLAFLAMDLERLGAVALADELSDDYRELSGASFVASLWHHYVAYRAFVRTVVALIGVQRGEPDAEAEARTLLALALAHLRIGEVKVILVGGAPGTGKSTLAGLLADRIDADMLSTDSIRREDPGDSRYRPDAVAAVYAQMLSRARLLLSHGRSVVLDATWGQAALREDAQAIAAETFSAIVEFECHAPTDLAAQRAQSRLLTGADASEAGAEVARALAAERDPWPHATAISTAGEPSDALAAMVASLQI